MMSVWEKKSWFLPSPSEKAMDTGLVTYQHNTRLGLLATQQSLPSWYGWCWKRPHILSCHVQELVNRYALWLFVLACSLPSNSFSPASSVKPVPSPLSSTLRGKHCYRRERFRWNCNSMDYIERLEQTWRKRKGVLNVVQWLKLNMFDNSHNSNSRPLTVNKTRV